jgi:hypothetical protein
VWTDPNRRAHSFALLYSGFSIVVSGKASNVFLATYLDTLVECLCCDSLWYLLSIISLVPLIKLPVQHLVTQVIF